MTNEQFLQWTFALGGCLALALGVGTFWFLRRPFLAVVGALPPRDLAAALKRLFPVTKILAALLGFLSVSYYGSCPGRSYVAIVSDRPYILARNQEQISTALLYLAAAVLLWGLVLTVILAVTASAPAEGGRPSG